MDESTSACRGAQDGLPLRLQPRHEGRGKQIYD